MGHQSRMNPFRHRASYRALMDLPLRERVSRLRDPETKTRILTESPDPTPHPPPISSTGTRSNGCTP